jgi:hypothetical protein
MSERDVELIPFTTLCWLSTSLTDEELKPIKNEIADIQNNYNLAVPYNTHLVGSIQKQFKLLKCLPYVENLLIDLVETYRQEFKLDKFDRITYLRDKKVRLKLISLWTNIQEKNEFNPMHNHYGSVSFIIWIKLPYNIEDEIKVFPKNLSNGHKSGHFEFNYLDPHGKMRCATLPIDKKHENRLVMFPSETHHTVYPFFTSDDCRISVSGNFDFRDEEENTIVSNYL